MKKTKFSPETDFEKENLDIIQNLKKIKEEELSKNFDAKLFKRISSEQRKTEKDFLRKILQVLKSAFKPERSIVLVYASLVIIMLFIGYLFLDKGSGSKNEQIVESKNETEQIHQNDDAGNITEDSLSEKDTRETYLKEIHQKVLMNASYGFMNNPTIEDVEQSLNSEKFKKKISAYKPPSIEDSVKIIIDILEEQD